MNKYYYVTDISNEVKKLDEKNPSIWIDLFRLGRWKHPIYGWIEGTPELFKNFIDNWKKNVLGRGVIFDKNHKPSDGGTAFLKDMKTVGDKLRGFIEFTKFGLELVKDKGFKYFSPEFIDKYTDKENPKIIHKDVLIGGALTLRPFLTNLAPIVLSEDIELELEGVCRFMDDPIDVEQIIKDMINRSKI